MTRIFSCKHDNRKSFILDGYGVKKNIEICSEDEAEIKMLPNVTILEIKY